MKSHFSKFVLLFLLPLFAISLIHAQETASLVGTVTDTTGAVVPGASVALTNPQTGFSATETTDVTGFYRFLKVPPGAGYVTTISNAGFSTAKISDITLSVRVSRTQNVKLTLGKNVETVEVSAKGDIVTLNTTDPSIGNNTDVNQLEELPIYNRSTGISNLFYLQPGVDANSAAVTGARTDQTSVSVDGLDVNDVTTGQAFAVVGTAPVDSIQQFTGSVAGLGASVGTGSGGQFQLVTKSGSNTFHGNINEYHRDTTTVSNSWFNNLTNIKRTPLIHNQFGADIGGPVLIPHLYDGHDKLFFYFDWADSRIIQSSTGSRTVPLADFRNGNLNYINNGTGCSSSSRKNTTPACITTLTPAQIKNLDPGDIGMSSAVTAYITSRYPAANDLSVGDGINTGGYRFTQPTPDTRHTYVTRVDYNLSPTQRVFFRNTITRRDSIQSLSEFDTDPVTHPFQDRSYGYVISHIWNIGKNKVNQFTYGDNIQKYNFPDVYNPTGANQYSFSGLSGPYTSFNGQQRRIPIPEVRDDFNWQKGNHSLTFGGTFKFIKTNSNLISNFINIGIGQQGSALSNGLASTVRPADILDTTTATDAYDSLFATGLGVIGVISTKYNYDAKGAALDAGSGAPKSYRFFQTEAYFGDNWKVTPKLTLSYGVRYQLYSVPYETHGYQSVETPLDFNTYIADRIAIGKSGDTSMGGLPLTSVVLGGKANNGPDLYNMSYKDLAPRFGFAYAPYRSQKTVINGSVGIIYDRTVINAVNFLQDQLSYLFSNTQTNQFGSSTAVDSLATDPRIGANLAFSSTLLPAPAALSKPYTPYVDSTGMPYGLADGDVNFVVDKNLKDPYSIAISFGVQQELPGRMVLKVNYVGRLGRRLLADADANQVIDVPDYSGKSTQTMVQAFADLTKQVRNGANDTNAISEPWFENNLGPHPRNGTKTRRVVQFAGTQIKNGDISDAINSNAYYSYYYYGNNYWPTNMGIPAQFGTNAYLTNKGSSNYHGLLLTLDKNLSHGLRFGFNYTWSHSIDNTSLIANNNTLTMSVPYGVICDVLQPRACRGNSDFDVRQEITSNFQYKLPFGRGRTFLANAPRAVDEAIGGWSISGLPSYRTGVAVNALSDAYIGSFENNAPAIFTGSKSDLKAKVNVDHTSNTVYTFAGGSAGASKVLSEFRGPIGLEYAPRNILRGPGAFNFDAGLAKTFPIIQDKVDLKFRADAYNVFNHPAFGTGNVRIVGNANNFGQITGTSNSARVAQFSLRLEF
jgi:hypothetical protein